MKSLIHLLTLFFLFSCFIQISAQNCDGGIAQLGLNENNVDARLNTTGNIWWDGSGDPGYEFPAGSGKHLFFSGGLWIGGVDAGGNLKLAAQTYGTSNGEFDYFPGPIDPQSGTVSDNDCWNWDRFFLANRADNELLQSDFNDNGQINNPIPTSIKRWPAQGNPFFEDEFGFPLPEKSMAPFVDQNQDGFYDPETGDYPKIKGSSAVWWVYNDIGNIHSQSNGDPLRMEIQALAYAYDQGNDLITNASFYEFKLIHYGFESISNYYTSFWTDPDLGCSNDDLIGCHPPSNLAYVYNSSSNDDCGASGYGSDVPIVGIKVLESNITSDGMMSGFSHYYRNNSSPPPLPGTWDPQSAQETYNYMQGLWADGLPLSQGGNGYDFNADPYPFAFDNSLIDGTPWTECTAGLPDGDRRFLMNFGPITLIPGQVQQLNLAVVTKTDAVYPCPEVDGLVDDANFVAAFDSIQTELINNANTPGPFAAFNYEFQTQQEIAFTDASFFNPDQWTWDFGDGATGTGVAPNHTYANEGTYTVCLTASNSIGSDTYCRDIFIKIQAPPVADFEFAINEVNNSLVVFTNMTINDPVTYLWDFGDGSTSIMLNPFHFYATLGVYEVCLTATNAGGEDTVCKEVDLLSTSTDEWSSLAYTLYPNPAKDFLHINFTESISPNLEIRLFDVLGKTVNPEIQKQESTIRITTQQLPKGLYFFELFDKASKYSSGKFMVH